MTITKDVIATLHRETIIPVVDRIISKLRCRFSEKNSLTKNLACTSVCYQRSCSHDLQSFSVWSCFVAAEGAPLVTRAWEDRVQALCTRTHVSKRLWAGLPCWQSSTSDGRQVTSTPVVIFVIIADRPVTRRATLGDRAFPVVAARAWNALYQTTSRQRQPTHHSVLHWRRICFPGLSDTDNMRHTDFVTWSWSAAVLAPR